MYQKYTSTKPTEWLVLMTRRSRAQNWMDRACSCDPACFEEAMIGILVTTEGYSAKERQSYDSSTIVSPPGALLRPLQLQK